MISIISFSCILCKERYALTLFKLGNLEISAWLVFPSFLIKKSMISFSSELRNKKSVSRRLLVSFFYFLISFFDKVESMNPNPTEIIIKVIIIGRWKLTAHMAKTFCGVSFWCV